ncbi:Lrp/AsnC family transcriptional regulator [Glaciecola siphonariae]|uniref:Lrp/AsnC family transcriptional regulator n=1 Tax=Glaciecola siphonariae TaxID=521012 RepID=A0ABV9LRW1_9ALTE
MNLSEQDKRILRLLEQDGRMSFAELASTVGLSKTPCWNRVKALQKQGFIKGYRAQLDGSLLGLEIRAFVHVIVNFNESAQFEASVNANDNILRCEAVTGDFDYLLEVAAPDMPRFDVLLRHELSKLPGVMRFSTSISTREIKHAHAYMPLI